MVLRSRSPVSLSTAALAACLALAAPALASVHSARPTYKSTRFAGYWSNAKAQGTVSDTTHIVVPSLSCTSGGGAIAASVGMYTTNEFSAANLILGCFKGGPQYFPELVVNGLSRNYLKFAAQPGDKVVLHITEGPGRTFVYVDDSTRRFTKSAVGGGSSSVSNPWVGDVGWSSARKKLERVPDFGTLRFSGSTLNGEPFGFAKALQRFERVTAPGTGTVQIKTGPFSSYREAFTTTFKYP